MASQPHHAGSHPRRARKLCEAAKANPNTVCWRCGRTLAAHPPHRNGKPAYWTAGHLIDGLKDGPLAPEASTCNYRAGAILRNQKHATPRPSRTW